MININSKRKKFSKIFYRGTESNVLKYQFDGVWDDYDTIKL